jgi:hypothetical protein
MTVGTYLFAYFVFTLVGAGDICLAIDHFKNGHYFRFGIWAMLAITQVLFLIELIFTN